MQEMLKGFQTEHVRAFEALALVGIRDEFEQRRTLLKAKHGQRLDSTKAGAPKGLQFDQLQQRITTLIPGKLRAKLPAHGGGAPELELLSLPGSVESEVLTLLKKSLQDTAYSVTPDLDSSAPVEMALSMWRAALSWCASLAGMFGNSGQEPGILLLIMLLCLLLPSLVQSMACDEIF
jgi:hypothetical protein